MGVFKYPIFYIDNVAYKKCSKCCNDKLLSNFYFYNKRNKYRSICDACHNNRAKEFYAKHKKSDRVLKSFIYIDGIANAECGTCKLTKNVTEFNTNKSKRMGITYECKKCLYVRNLKYKETEKYKNRIRRQNRSEHRKIWKRNYYQSTSDNLSDQYIKTLLVNGLNKRSDCVVKLCSADIPREAIEIKRFQLTLWRYLHERNRNNE